MLSIIKDNPGAMNRAAIKDNLVYLVFLVPVVIGVSLMINAAQDASDVASRERAVTGILTAHDAWNHDQWEYRFRVEGRVYTGLDRVPSGVPKVDQPVTIYFDPHDPTTNGLIPFERRRDNFLGPAIAILLGAAFVVALMLVAAVLQTARREP